MESKKDRSFQTAPVAWVETAEPGIQAREPYRQGLKTPAPGTTAAANKPATATGYSTYTLPSGDSINTHFEGQWSSTGFEGNFKIVGGTGRFQGARGDGLLTGLTSPWPETQLIAIEFNIINQKHF